MNIEPVLLHGLQNADPFDLVVLYALWRFDKRVFRLELVMERIVSKCRGLSRGSPSRQHGLDLE